MAFARPGTGVVVAAVVVTLLAGCAGDDPDGTEQSPTTSASASPDDAQDTTTAAPVSPTSEDAATATADPGTVVAAGGTFQVTMPAEWTDVGAQLDQPVELALRAEQMSADFFPNVVVASEAPIDDLKAAMEQAAADIAGDDGTHEVLDPIEVAGETAYGYTVTRTTSGLEIAQTQRWIEHGDQLYVVTLSTAAARTDEGSAALEGILASWEWLD